MRGERPTGNRVEDVSEFSRGLKRLACELDCAVIAAQLSHAVAASTPGARWAIGTRQRFTTTSRGARRHALAG
ncbi:MAG: hypothetical protein JO153_11870 [Solirubrobacterales bacterium]|nr:hypothetical protein [Solirubrobacterales bacterium]